MNYIILDLEWNQPFEAKKMVRHPVLLTGEIIQIGAVKLDENHHLIDTFKIAVKPVCYKIMHKKVSKLTNIKTADLQYGFPFEKAFRHFKNWCGDDFCFLTWGADDIGILRQNIILHDINTEWIPNTYNLQIIFDNQLTKTNRQISLINAMECVGETPLVAHDALNDARNTASICSHIDIDKGLMDYPALEKEFSDSDSFEDKSYRNGKVYQTRAEALNDDSLTEFCCPDCGSKVVCVDFKRQNSSKYICIGKCEKGEKLFVRFKFKSAKDGTFTVSRIIYDLNEENYAYYNAKVQSDGSDDMEFHEVPREYLAI